MLEERSFNLDGARRQSGIPIVKEKTFQMIYRVRSIHDTFMKKICNELLMKARTLHACNKNKTNWQGTQNKETTNVQQLHSNSNAHST